VPYQSGAAALTAAYASHLLLDWLSKDTSKPSGLAVLWPFTFNYYVSAGNIQRLASYFVEPR